MGRLAVDPSLGHSGAEPGPDLIRGRNRCRTASVIQLKNGIQILGPGGMDSGSHRGDDSAGMTNLFFA